MNEKKSILMVFTGGTISSRMHKKARELGSAPYCLLDTAKKSRYSFDTIEPISVLSENITPEMLRVLFCSIDRAFSPGKHCGVMIAHGTDTMTYTAQLAQLIFERYPVPVVLFGSKRPADDPQSDAQTNFNAALSLVAQVEKGVYVVSLASDGKTYAHHAGWVQSADIHTDDFSSFRNLFAGTFSRGKFVPNNAFTPPPVVSGIATALSRIKKLPALSSEQTVLCIPASCCTAYETYHVGMPSIAHVLVQPYHSGTANALSEDNPYSLLFLKRACDAKGKGLFFGPYDMNKTLYSSTRALLDAGIIPVPDMPFETAWAILMLCTWLGIKPEKLFKSYRTRSSS